MPTAPDPLYRRHRFPPEVISYAVWLYVRFPLSLRMGEEMLATRGIWVTYETGERIPQRRIAITSLPEIADAVTAFARAIQAANPTASFEVSARVISGRKPCGFDAADHATAFGGRAFLRSDVDDSELHQRLLDPVAA